MLREYKEVEKMYSQGSRSNREEKYSESQTIVRHNRMIIEASLLAKIKAKGLPLQEYNIEALGLTTRTAKRLRMAHINTVQDLVNCTESDMLYIPRVGVATLENIKSKLRAYLSMNVNGTHGL
jgi:DNA-directed RNA polymerase alpha subunit